MDRYRSDPNGYTREYRKKAYYKEWKNRPEVKAKIKAYLKEYHKTYKLKPERILRNRDIRLQREYGITLETYNALLVQQHERCAICGIHQTLLKKRLAVDHDHRTNKVRGLLCEVCNRFVVMVLEKYKPLLTKAANYLGEHLEEKCL